MANRIKNYLVMKLGSSINDVDFEKVADMFVNNGGYNENLSFTDNMNELYKTIALGKANNVI